MEGNTRNDRGTGGELLVSFIYNQRLKLPNLTVDSLNFHINDYEILTTVYGERIDGIIGYSVISRYIIKLNYDSSIIEFWSKGAMRYPRGGYLLRPHRSLHYGHGNLPKEDTGNDKIWR